MRLASCALAFFAVIWSAGIAFEHGLPPAAASELAATIGGAGCWNCLGPVADPACKPGFLGDPTSGCEFQAGKSFCTKYTFTNLSVAYCNPAASGADGTSDCKADTPAICVKIQTCTDCDSKANTCNSCGEASSEDKPTKCTPGKYKCKG